MSELILKTPYHPKDCRRRIEAAAIADRHLLSRCKFLPCILARITDHRFRLRVRRAVGHNSFDRYFYGSVESAAAGALIRGRYRVPGHVKGFMGFYFLFTVVVGGPIFSASITSIASSSVQNQGNPWVGVLVPPLMLGGGGWLLWLGRRFSRPCEQLIADFLTETLQARELPPAA